MKFVDKLISTVGRYSWDKKDVLVLNIQHASTQGFTGGWTGPGGCAVVEGKS